MVTSRRSSFEVGAAPEDVWAFIEKAGNRAEAIRFVTDYRLSDETNIIEWKVSIPVVDRAIWLETEDVKVEAPTFVRFVGEARIGEMVGEYEVERLDGGGSRVTQMLRVDSWVPKLESAFEARFDEEFEYFEQVVRDGVGKEE